MPPKPKLTKDEIASMALTLIREEGVEALTARELGKRLGVSSTPIFTVFRNMDEVKQAARALCFTEFQKQFSDLEFYTPAFKRVGMLTVKFALEEPELFKLLFMQAHTEHEGFENTFHDLGDVGKVCLRTVQRDYELSEADARSLFEAMWLYTFGVAAMCAMKVCQFSEEETALRLGQAFAGMITIIKSRKYNSLFTAQPEKDSNGMYNGIKVGDLPFVKE